MSWPCGQHFSGPGRNGEPETNGQAGNPYRDPACPEKPRSWLRELQALPEPEPVLLARPEAAQQGELEEALSSSPVSYTHLDVYKRQAPTKNRALSSNE